MPTETLEVTEIYDENDDLVGYGVLATSIDGNSMRMRPEVYGVRSEAHAAIGAS